MQSSLVSQQAREQAPLAPQQAREQSTEQTQTRSPAILAHAHSNRVESSKKSAATNGTSFQSTSQTNTALELRRDAKESTPSVQEPEPSRVVKIEAPPSINVEQLQKAISELPQLNPDQLADQVYKSLMKRLKLEQRLRGI